MHGQMARAADVRLDASNVDTELNPLKILSQRELGMRGKMGWEGVAVLLYGTRSK